MSGGLVLRLVPLPHGIDASSGSELLLLHLGERFAGENEDAIPAPLGECSMTGCVELGLLQDLGAQLCGDDIQEHTPGHIVGVLELFAVEVKELVPAVDVLAHIRQLFAAPILAQTLSTGVLNDLPLSLEFPMKAAPDGKAVAFFCLSSSQLGSAEVKSFGKPINDDLLELLGEVEGRFIVRADHDVRKVGEIQSVVRHREEIQHLPPARMHLAHVVRHMGSPCGEAFGEAIEPTERIALSVHRLLVAHPLSSSVAVGVCLRRH